MKYHPIFIVLWAISRYVSEEQFLKLRGTVGVPGLIRPKTLLRHLREFMEPEVLIKKPLIPEDAWIFNYLMYEARNSFPKTKLIKRYEKEIVLPVEKNFREMEGLLHPKT
jgi:hypothetical protein